MAGGRRREQDGEVAGEILAVRVGVEFNCCLCGGGGVIQPSVSLWTTDERTRPPWKSLWFPHKMMKPLFSCARGCLWHRALTGGGLWPGLIEVFKPFKHWEQKVVTDPNWHGGARGRRRTHTHAYAGLLLFKTASFYSWCCLWPWTPQCEKVCVCECVCSFVRVRFGRCDSVTFRWAQPGVKRHSVRPPCYWVHLSFVRVCVRVCLSVWVCAGSVYLP